MLASSTLKTDLRLKNTGCDASVSKAAKISGVNLAKYTTLTNQAKTNKLWEATGDQESTFSI